MSAAPRCEGKKLRCAVCALRLGVTTAFTCACSKASASASPVFCATHRYPHAHACSVNHRALQRERIAASNPLVTHEKFERL